MADEKGAVPFYKSARAVIAIIVIGAATALFVFGYIAVDAYERLVLGAVGASA